MGRGNKTVYIPTIQDRFSAVLGTRRGVAQSGPEMEEELSLRELLCRWSDLVGQPGMAFKFSRPLTSKELKSVDEVIKDIWKDTQESFSAGISFPDTQTIFLPLPLMMDGPAALHRIVEAIGTAAGTYHGDASIWITFDTNEEIEKEHRHEIWHPHPDINFGERGTYSF